MIKKYLFLVAGYGTHFLPVTKAIHKEMLLVLTKPGKVIANKFNSKRFDCGSINGFVEDIKHFHTKTKIYAKNK